MPSRSDHNDGGARPRRPSEGADGSESREERFSEWLVGLRLIMDRDSDRDLPESLVTRPDSAVWLAPEVTKNASRVGLLIDVPAKSMEFYLQELAPDGASDLQRHNHESVHIVLEGSGYSEIGERRVEWSAGDLIYTPVMAWHRHYNTSRGMVRMLLVENSPLLESLGLNRRESAGNIPYHDLTNGGS